MNLLVSDYDNTFHIKDEDMEKNIEKANEFMKNNLFAIATGRSYDSYMQAKEKFDINTNYTILNHGGTILKGDNVIYNYSMDKNLKEEIIKLIHLEHAVNINCYYGVEEVDINSDFVTKMIIEYDDEKIVPEIVKLVNEQFSDKLKTYLFTNFKSLEIIPIEIDKSYAIEHILKLEDIDNIYVIGDNHNDYLMIKNYNGSCTHVAVDKVKQIAKKVYINVSDYIEEIME